MKKDTNSKLFYEGEIMSYQKAGSVLIRKMIEEDLPKHKKLDKNENPYDWIANSVGKKRSTVRSWAYDWSTSSGASPTINDLFHLIHTIGTDRIYNFLQILKPGHQPEEESVKYGNMIRMVANHMRGLAEDLDTMSNDYIPGKNGRKRLSK